VTSSLSARRLTGTLAYVALSALAVAAVALLPQSDYMMHILVQTASYAIAVFGLIVVLGLCGQINLAQAAFFGFGAYAVGLGTADLNLNFWVALALGAGVALVMGAFLGMTTLRLGGHYLAMVTISFQQIVTLIMVNWIPVTHGPDGVGSIRRPALFESTHAFLGLCLLVMAAIGYMIWRLPQTPLGRSMRAVRDNELAAGVAGINVYRVKVAAFALSAVLGGIGGGLFAGGFAYVSPDQFSFAESIVFMTMALLGGVASPVGALIGTALLIVLPESLRFLKSVPGLYLAIYGLSIILIIRYMPEGIWGFVQHRVRHWFAPAPFAHAAAELTLTPTKVDAPMALEVHNLSKYFGGLKAVDDISFAVRRGEVHALIGPNGSGKTTTLNVLSGLYTETAGRIVLSGHDVTRLPPYARTAAGMGRTFQNIRLFRSMPALENVIIGAEHAGNDIAAGRAALVERARAALAFVGLEARAQERVTGFSYGHQRLIEIARALAGNPSLLLLDEPAAGLNSSEKQGLRDLLKRIAAKGLTILIIDHDMTLVTEVAERITVLNFGRRIADGVAGNVLRQPDVIAAYLGTEPDAPAHA
jgi:branched-chain amino acid transport system ATP-binding protein/branched-chain amino acid transport system permease protein